jgi:hypothetical protein
MIVTAAGMTLAQQWKEGAALMLQREVCGHSAWNSHSTMNICCTSMLHECMWMKVQLPAATDGEMSSRRLMHAAPAV